MKQGQWITFKKHVHENVGSLQKVNIDKNALECTQYLRDKFKGVVNKGCMVEGGGYGPGLIQDKKRS